LVVTIDFWNVNYIVSRHIGSDLLDTMPFLLIYVLQNFPEEFSEDKKHLPKIENVKQYDIPII
jgi:hypothetical protein